MKFLTSDLGAQRPLVQRLQGQERKGKSRALEAESFLLVGPVVQRPGVPHPAGVSALATGGTQNPCGPDDTKREPPSLGP